MEQRIARESTFVWQNEMHTLASAFLDWSLDDTLRMWMGFPAVTRALFDPKKRDARVAMRSIARAFSETAGLAGGWGYVREMVFFMFLYERGGGGEQLCECRVQTKGTRVELECSHGVCVWRR